MSSKRRRESDEAVITPNAKQIKTDDGR